MNPSNLNTPRKSTRWRKIAWYTALKDPDPTKLTPHASEIIRAIKSYGRPATRAEVVVALAQRIRGSKQNPTRILSFHRKLLLAAGFIRIAKKLEPAEHVGNRPGMTKPEAFKAQPLPQAAARRLRPAPLEAGTQCEVRPRDSRGAIGRIINQERSLQRRNGVTDPMTHAEKEARSLELLVEAHGELGRALQSLVGKQQDTLHAGYLYHASRFISSTAEGYLLLRGNGLIDASQVLVRPALEASFRIRAVHEKPELLYSIAHHENEEDEKWARLGTGGGAVAAALVAKVQADWATFKREYQVRFPKHILTDHILGLRDIVVATNNAPGEAHERYYDSHYRLYCKVTHAALRATSGSLRDFVLFDTPTVAGCVLTAVAALKSIGASVPRLKSLWGRFVSLDCA